MNHSLVRLFRDKLIDEFRKPFKVTIVDVVVAVAIIAVLIVVMLPAVHADGRSRTLERLARQKAAQEAAIKSGTGSSTPPGPRGSPSTP